MTYTFRLKVTLPFYIVRLLTCYQYGFVLYEYTQWKSLMERKLHFNKGFAKRAYYPPDRLLFVN